MTFDETEMRLCYRTTIIDLWLPIAMSFAYVNVPENEKTFASIEKHLFHLFFYYNYRYYAALYKSSSMLKENPQ